MTPSELEDLERRVSHLEEVYESDNGFVVRQAKSNARRLRKTLAEQQQNMARSIRSRPVKDPDLDLLNSQVAMLQALIDRTDAFIAAAPPALRN